MVYDCAKELADALKASDEYRDFCAAKERAFENETTRALLMEYQKLRVRAQASALSGERSEELMNRFQKLAELLQFDAEASEFLMAEYRLNTMLGDVYKILAQAVEIDLSGLEA